MLQPRTAGEVDQGTSLAGSMSSCCFLKQVSTDSTMSSQDWHIAGVKRTTMTCHYQQSKAL